MPKLTKPQMARLVEIGRGLFLHPRTCKKSTEHLEDVGAICFGFRVIGGPFCRLTPFGISILAGLPGAEFDKFRAMLEKANG